MPWYMARLVSLRTEGMWELIDKRDQRTMMAD